jgi:hypothetical protein
MTSVRLPCRSQLEADAILRAWQDPELRAFVLIVGFLLPLDSNARERIVRFTRECLEDDQRRRSA